MSAYLINFTDPSLARIGQFLDDYSKLEMLLQVNQPDSSVIDVADTPTVAELAVPGNRIEVWRDAGAGSGWSYLTGGPIEKPTSFRWKLDDPEAGDPGLRSVYFTDDSVPAICRAVYPDPAHAWTAQAAARYVITATNAEDAMRSLVNLNAGPGALVARRAAHLVLGSDLGIGTNVTASFRMEALGDALRTLALAGGDLGYRFVRVGSTIEFQVYEFPDLSDSVRFSRALGNLTSIAYDTVAPAATVALVGGDGTGTSRAARERENATATALYGRRETFVNNGSGTNAELDTAGDEALVAQGEQATLAVEALDTATQRFGIEYPLGARVSVEVRPGELITDVVTAIHITYADGVENVQPQIGSGQPITSNSAATLAVLRDLSRRLGIVERTA